MVYMRSGVQVYQYASPSRRVLSAVQSRQQIQNMIEIEAKEENVCPYHSPYSLPLKLVLPPVSCLMRYIPRPSPSVLLVPVTDFGLGYTRPGRGPSYNFVDVCFTGENPPPVVCLFTAASVLYPSPVNCRASVVPVDCDATILVGRVPVLVDAMGDRT